MINWSSKHIAFIAGLFIVFFLGALTINTLCDLEIIDYASNLSHNHEESTHTTLDDHHADDNLAHDHGSNRGKATGNHHSGSEEDECCNDAATILTSSLYSGIVKIAVPATKYFLAGIIEFKPQLISLYQVDNIIYHEYDDPPPLNGFELRVEIQSFLN